MELVFCLAAFEPAVEFGGPVAKVKILAQLMIQRGHRVEVWCADYGSSRSRVPVGSALVDGVPVRYFRRFVDYRWSAVAPATYVAGRHSSFDVAHVFGIRDGVTVLATAAFQRQGVPTLIEPMGMFKPRGRKTRTKGVFDRLITDRQLRGAAAVIATSDMERRELGLTNVVVRPNPVRFPTISHDDSFKHTLAIGDAPLAVSIGRISVSKGLDVLVKAVASIPEVHLVIIGPDDLDGARGKLDDAIAQSGVAARVHILGAAFGRERDAVLAAADVFVLPSRHESFGNAAVEAAGVGIPVVISDQCGVAHELEDLDAAIVCGTNAADLVSALQAGLSRQWNRQTAESVRARFNPTRVADVQEALYRRVLEGN